MAQSSPPSSKKHGAGTYEMLWDCRFCGTQKLLGVTHRHCPNCGAAQDPAYRYFPAEEDMVALTNHKYVGADKTCPNCGQPNSAANLFCSECGADMATGKIVNLQQEVELGTGGLAAETRQDVVLNQFQAEMTRVGATPQAAPILLGLRKKELLIVGGVLLLALCIIGGVFALTYSKETSGEITKMTWERTIDIQVFQARSDGSWDESVPGDAYSKSCREKQRSSRQVPDGSHEECRNVDQGDGSFRRDCRTVQDYRSEPVYDTWCDYKVDRWGYARSVKVDGSGEQPAPEWPAYSLASGSGRGAERAGEQHEKYIVVIRDKDGKERSCDFENQSAWSKYDVGMKVSVKVNIAGDPDCESIVVTQ